MVSIARYNLFCHMQRSKLLLIAFALLCTLPGQTHAATVRPTLQPVFTDPGPAIVPAPTADSGSSVSDFLIQDVCTDAKGKVIALDPASPACTHRRNLQYGEKLPYHKTDQHGSDANPAAANGYQRSDSFPVSKDSSLVGHTLDFGVGGGTFGRKDANDGFNLYETRGTYASAIATQDAVGGIQYFIAPTCVNGNGNEDSWGLFPTAMKGTGSNLFSLQIASTPDACPGNFAQSYTAWEFPSSPLTYTNGTKLVTALSYHYASPTVAASDHLEKFYFTREYGATRWERWERPNTPYHSQEKERAASKAALGVCNGPSVTYDSAGPWYLVDCREWTNIIPDTNPSSKWYNPLSWNIPTIPPAPKQGGTVANQVSPSATPTIEGTAQGIATLGISIDNGDKVYGSGPVIPVVNGKWSHTVTASLANGKYTVSLYTPNSVLLASGSLTVNASRVPVTTTSRLPGTPVSPTPPSTVPVVTAPSAMPDLTVNPTSPISAVAGVPFTMTALVKNIGTGATSGNFSDFWQVCDLGCATLSQYGTGQTAPLAAGATRNVSFTYTLPNPGTYYYTMCADLPAAVAETNEDNNCSTGVAITVRAPAIQAVTPTPQPGSGRLMESSAVSDNSASAYRAVQSALKAILKGMAR